MAGLGIGLIGTGYMGKCHALAWNNVSSIFGDVDRPHLATLAEINAELAEKKAAELGFARSTGNWRDLLSDPSIDVISVTTPNAFHAEMAIAALEAGKHVWCEKPMAPALADAIRMRDAAARSGRVAVMGYNYIQNPMIRHIRRLIGEGAIGAVNHVRVEMDEDFMADPAQPFYWKSEASSGYGALDDFAVHPLSLLFTLFGHVEAVVTDMVKPYATRPLAGGGSRPVENHDIASVLLRLEGGISAVLMANRSAWGRKGRIAVQIFGSAGSILFDQERMNEFQLYQASGRPEEQGFRTILAAPPHKPYDRFIPAPGHGLGFNDLKVIECRELIAAIGGDKAHVIGFDDGLRIERSVHAMAQSFAEQRWVTVEG
ncbi:MAG: Gfo/Idh/MocA family oxidoreductase [Alphaproteobacteria bacterium]|nr:Gfo/Idh/MocA family oxidoreductase [Rhizobiaceae bacterium]MBU3962339.1 Gfo/Idh/MocA family oxidoreductase [Alphaproteobacteria bacterium]MBU4049005.1 Gfo/Idh/MocA family oxidoreductase [Alphaproteobacteria bacterium]MBU4091704.1 Gfo/Idh/MocA family oxidoreductase [Alphaproteobacteria bacterium]MBU4156993.1 Gfo/Idh/MocA family oxidoreductase [Alphaproteobacteria bacterium]